MKRRIDPLEGTERVGRAVAVSLICHAALFSGSILWSAFHAPFSMGESTSQIGGAVPVSVVQGVPITPSRSRVENPVANPVQHDVPAVSTKKQPPPPEPPPDDAVEVEKQRKRVYPQRFAQRKRAEPAPNQLSSSTGARANSPLLSGQQSTGAGVGFGQGSPFGTRFGWYAEALQRRVAQEWRRTLGQTSGSSSRPVVVSFRISRNGRIDNVRIAQTSGNRSLDYSAFRAVINASPVQPLPPALRRSTITVEIWFRLK